MATVKLRAKAPKFTIPATDGDFRDLAPAFRRLRTRILGISTDTLESHRRFREKMKFPFDNVWQKDDGNRAQHLPH